MRSLHAAMRQRGDTGEELPLPYQQLVDEGVSMKRGQLTLIAASPGKGKSLLALNLVLAMGVPSLVMSGDTDAFTTGVRAAAWTTGHDQDTISRTYETGDDFYSEKLLPMRDFARFDFKASPTQDDIKLEMEAFELTFGEWPHLVVVDNLSNLYVHDDEWTNLRQGLEFLHDMARQTAAHVAVLHHLEGSYDDGELPPRLSSLRGKVSKVPEQVLGLSGSSDSMMRVSVLKNRSGPSSATGDKYGWLHVSYNKGRVS